MGLTRPRAYQIFDIDYKQSVRVITLTNINLTGGAPSQVDGVTLSLNDRVLVAGQSTASQNGLYYVTTLGTGSNGTWQRSIDGNETGEIESGMIVMVTEGLIWADTSWKLVTNDPITIGSTALTFEQNTGDAFGNIIANGTAITANTASGILNLSAGNNISITGNNETKTVSIAVTGISLNSISNGTSNVNVTSSGGNVTVGVGGTNNVVVVSSTGQFVSGVNSVTGNVTGGNLLTGGIVSATGNITGGNVSGTLVTGTLTTAAQPNVTSVGTLTSLSVSGNITGGNLTINDNAVITGNLTVNGTTTTINANTLNINDKDVVVANNVTGSANIDGAGLLAGNPTTASFVYRNATTSWQSNVGIAPAANATLNLGGVSNYWANAYLGAAIVAGNVTGGNVTTTGLISATGNVTGGNVLTGGLVSATANVTGGNLLTGGLISATGNITGGNVSTAGNVTGAYFLGNVACASGIFTTKIFNGTSEANIGTSGGNANISIGGTSNVAVFTTAGLNVTGIVSATGNITGGNILGNGYNLTGINAFATISVTGQSNVVADSIADTLTLAAGSGISITTDAGNDIVTISSVATDSIFATGGDMGTIDQAVTVSEDLGSITTSATVEYDLGTLTTAGIITPSLLLLPTYTVAQLGNVSASPAGQFVYCSNESGGAVPAFSDGTNWRRVTDRAIVS